MARYHGTPWLTPSHADPMVIWLAQYCSGERFTLREVANMSAVSHETIRLWMTGSVSPQLHNFRRVLKPLGYEPAIYRLRVDDRHRP